MKNLSTKIAYMVIGSILTIIGYHFGNIENNAADAQGTVATSTEIINKIRVRQIEIVGNDNSPRIYMGTDLDRGQIKFVGDSDTSQMSLKAASNGGQIKLHNRSGKQKILLGLSDDRGRIMIVGEDGNNKVVLYEDNHGGGVMVGSSEYGKSEARLTIEEFGPMVSADSEHGSVDIVTFDRLGATILVDSKSGGSVKLQAKDSIGVMEIYDKSDKKLIHAGGTEETGGFLATLNKDGTITNSVGETKTSTSTSTSTFQKKVIRTRSIDLDRYKQAPGNIIR